MEERSKESEAWLFWDMSPGAPGPPCSFLAFGPTALGHLQTSLWTSKRIQEVLEPNIFSLQDLLIGVSVFTEKLHVLAGNVQLRRLQACADCPLHR